MRTGLIPQCCTERALRALIAGLLVFCPGMPALAADSTATDGTPTGMVAFFATTSCPTGWNVATDVQGRAVVAVQSSSDVGVVVGTPLQDKTAPVHAHSYQTTVTLSNKHAALITGGKDNAYATSGSATVSGKVDEAPSDLPFVQLVACQKK